MTARRVPPGEHRVGERVVARVELADTPGRDGPNGPTRCWRYATAGLEGGGQREVVLFWRADRTDAAPVEPLAMLAGVAAVVAGGQRVGPGDWTEFAATTGRRAACYAVMPEGLECGDGSGQGALVAVTLRDAEVGLVESFGTTRLLARLGAAAGTHPFPVVYDSARSPVAEDREATILESLPRLRVAGAVELRGMTICVELDRRSLEPVRQALLAAGAGGDGSGSVALLTDWPAGAAAQLVWHAGQSGARAIHASAGRSESAAAGLEGDRLGGAFVAFLADAERDGGVLVEDGFCVRLSDPTWREVRDALGQGRDASVSAAREQDYSLQLRWR